MANNDYALLFAINKYRDSNTWKKLNGPVNDSKRFKTWLLGLGQVPKNNITEIAREDGRTPTFSDLMIAVDDLSQAAPSGSRIGRRLYIFLAGHGIESTRNAVIEPLLVTAEASDRMIVGFPGQRALDFFRISARFEEVVLFMDCCRDMDRTAPEPSWWPEFKPDRAARNVLFGTALATQIFSKSREKKLGTKVQGIFTNALMDGLEGKATDGNGQVTGASLTRYLEDVLTGDQQPEVDLNPNIVFIDNFEAKTIPVNIPIESVGQTVVIRDGLDPDTEIDTDMRTIGNKVQVNLPAYRTYLVQSVGQDGSVIKESGITVENEAVDVVF